MNGIYYLSWGCYYALGHSPYGVRRDAVVPLRTVRPAQPRRHPLPRETSGETRACA